MSSSAEEGIGPCRSDRKGPFIKDVRTKGGRGVSPKADIVREVAWIYSYRSDQNADKGGEGVKNLENFADVLYVWPLIYLFSGLCR